MLLVITQNEVTDLSEMDLRFGGIQRLYGKKAFVKIQQAHIAVIGLGGVGSWAAEALARTGIGHMTLVDFDDICVSNTNRQLHALQDQVGRPKTLAMKERLMGINPQLQVNVIDAPYERDTEAEIFKQSYSGVVDAIDHGLTKFELILACKERRIPIVISGTAGGRLDPSQIKTDDLAKSQEDPMLSAVRKKLRQRGGYPRKGRMGLPCVFTTEKPRYSDSQGEILFEKPKEFNKPLDCSTGFGTTTPVTGTFGFCLSHLMILEILR